MGHIMSTTAFSFINGVDWNSLLNFLIALRYDSLKVKTKCYMLVNALKQREIDRQINICSWKVNLYDE